MSEDNIDLDCSYIGNDVSFEESFICSDSLHENMPVPCNQNKYEKNASLENGYKYSEKDGTVLDPSPSNSDSKSSQNLTNITAEEEISNSLDKFTTSDSFDELSYKYSESDSSMSESKVAEFKDSLVNVNSIYVNWMVNDFVLDIIKNKSTSWSKQIKEVTKSFEIQNNIKLRSEDGEVTNLLGLEEEDIKLYTSRFLALINKSAFRDHVMELVKANLAKLKLQRKAYQEDFGAHCIRAVVGVMTRERREQLELQKHVEDLQSQARQLLSSNQSIVQQLITLRHNTDRHLQSAAFSLLRNKALYLQTLTSIYREKLDQTLLVDKNMKKKMDTEGNNLKSQITEMREELMTLQKKLTEYEKKESVSKKYKEIVLEYGKLKKQLGHKNLTLKMLNDPNKTF